MVGVTIIADGLLRNLAVGSDVLSCSGTVPRVITDPVMELERQVYPEPPFSSALKAF